ncbi:hypothetical protein [Methylobacterium planeticum]|uniref:Uncharacterized protein n=1 Tax=Methylobacterium planeticum TaxID=2615211 RepID=A0A6N6MZE1_9HYPH|nr:hypothetical protein [Methylobacterium planeticum]KAB1075753.1 hypothetical protein F6X51_03565 [Methylobacterium planeticum]
MSTKNDPARAERLKAALRDNLRRRKAQGRERAAPDAREPGNAAGTAPETPEAGERAQEGAQEGAAPAAEPGA